VAKTNVHIWTNLKSEESENLKTILV